MTSTELAEAVIRDYESEGLTQWEIAERYGLHTGIVLRTLYSEGMRRGKRLVCPTQGCDCDALAGNVELNEDGTVFINREEEG